MKGYLAYGQYKGKRPGVLVVHEWWLNDYARKRQMWLNWDIRPWQSTCMAMETGDHLMTLGKSHLN